MARSHAGGSPAWDHGPADSGVAEDEGPGPQPVEEVIAVRRLQDRPKGIGGLSGARSERDREQVQVVVAEHALRTEPDGPPQHPERVGATVHEVAREPDAIRRGVRVEPAKKRVECLQTPLHVANDPGGHGGSVQGGAGAEEPKGRNRGEEAVTVVGEKTGTRRASCRSACGALRRSCTRTRPRAAGEAVRRPLPSPWTSSTWPSPWVMTQCRERSFAVALPELRMVMRYAKKNWSAAGLERDAMNVASAVTSML